MSVLYNEKPPKSSGFFKFSPRIKLSYRNYFFDNGGVVKMNFSFFRKGNDAFFESKKSVVFAHTDVLAGQDIRTALSYDN